MPDPLTFEKRLQACNEILSHICFTRNQLTDLRSLFIPSRCPRMGAAEKRNPSPAKFTKERGTMKTSNKGILSVPMLIAGSIALAGCGPGGPTVITYHQVGTCKSYPTPTGVDTAKTDEGFAIFKIETVDNSKHNDIFNVDPERFYINQSSPAQMAQGVYNWNRRFLNPDPRFARNLGYTQMDSTPLAPNEKRDVNTYVVVPLGINNPSQGPEDKKYVFDFAYDTGSNERGNIQSVSEGITFVKTDPPDTKYSVIESCKELIK
jgi:hypothetical protein